MMAAMVARGFSVWRRGRFWLRETRLKRVSSEAVRKMTKPRFWRRGRFSGRRMMPPPVEITECEMGEREARVADSVFRKKGSPCSAKIWGMGDWREVVMRESVSVKENWREVARAWPMEDFPEPMGPMRTRFLWVAGMGEKVRREGMKVEVKKRARRICPFPFAVESMKWRTL